MASRLDGPCLEKSLVAKLWWIASRRSEAPSSDFITGRLSTQSLSPVRVEGMSSATVFGESISVSLAAMLGFVGRFWSKPVFRKSSQSVSFDISPALNASWGPVRCCIEGNEPFMSISVVTPLNKSGSCEDGIVKLRSFASTVVTTVRPSRPIPRPFDVDMAAI